VTSRRWFAGGVRGRGPRPQEALGPLGAVGKAAVEAVGAGWYFYQMPAQTKAWCGYCIFGALVNAGVFAFTLPEAREALAALREGA